MHKLSRAAFWILATAALQANAQEKPYETTVTAGCGIAKGTYTLKK